MLGGYAMTAITAVTAQNTLGVTAVEALSPEMVGGADRRLPVATSASTRSRSACSARPRSRMWSPTGSKRWHVPVVFDPVMVATSGAVLADAATIAGFERLMALATLTTPNVAELAALGRAPTAHGAARGVAYLAKGGDAEGAGWSRTVLVPARRRTTASGDRAHRHPPHPRHRLHAVERDRHAARQGPAARATRSTEAREFVRAALLAAPGFGARPRARWATRRCAS